MHKVVRRALSALLVAGVVTTLCALGLSANAFAGFQRRATDSLFPSAQSDSDVVVVGIDSETIQRVGEVPLPRSIDATLGGRIAEAGAKVIAWDLIFTAPRPGDDELASALGIANSTVLAEAVSAKPGDRNVFDVVRVDGAPIPALASGPATTIGHTLVTPDHTDGVIRTVPVVVDNKGQLMPSLALAALRAMKGETGPVLVRPDGVQVAGRFIPTEGNHQLRLNFAKNLESEQAKNVVSAADVLDGKVPASRFKDKVVFIGATASILGDSKLVPVDKSNTFPGVMIHANALNTMLTASYLSPVGDTETVLWIGFVSLLVALAVVFLPVWMSALATVIIAALYLVIGFARFDAGRVMNFVYMFVAILASFVIALAVRYFTETRHRRRVSSLFAQYVPEAVAKTLEESGSLDEHLEGERLDVSLFFCDLRGFTSLSATLEPSQVRAMLNEFYELVTDSILSFGGTVMKFVGDEVFAVFGAPLPIEHHARCALDCAMDIQRRAPDLVPELAKIGVPQIFFGIGMNSGDVVAAHIGAAKRRQYDVVGDTVNVGSRLCGQAGKGEIVIPESMIPLLGDDPPPMEAMGAVQLKGLDEPLPLYKIVVGESEPRFPSVAAAPVPGS